MISQTAEYALRAMVYLAGQTEPRTTALIAEQTLIPEGYLAKVMHGLSRAKLVHAQRGPHGGFTVAQPAAELAVLTIVNAVDPVRRFHDCPLGLHGRHLCPLHCKLDEAAQAVELTFAGTTLADLARDTPQAGATCVFPLAQAIAASG